jgi:Histidine kinase-, DNA gyrase B-, and HSP90-like ATPase/Response regulator receiver domain
LTETNDHVLIVDDDRGIRELLAGNLEEKGMRVSLAANGRQMRAALDQGAPDLIALDLMMPGEDGLVLCHELRAGKFGGNARSNADRPRRGSRPARATCCPLPQALRGIPGNLVDNALKYGRAAEITIATGHDGQAIVSVMDRGPGIPAESLETVFEPFYRLEASRNRHTGGTGLGLAIARQLAVAMDATLTLRNRVGGGPEAQLMLRKLG